MKKKPVGEKDSRTKFTAIQRLWRDRLAATEPGLSISELASRFGASYPTVQRWAAFFAYAIHDGRGRSSTADWENVDWGQTNIDIARRLDVSRERVRQVRVKLRAAKSPLPPLSSGNGVPQNPIKEPKVRRATV